VHPSALPYSPRMPPYYPIDDLVMRIDEPNRTACLRLLADHRDLFSTVQGPTQNHQTWRGGYLDHVTEALNIAVVLYTELSTRRPLPFSLSDILLVVYLHDLEKPWAFERAPNGVLQRKASMATKEAHQTFRRQKLMEYGVVLTSEQENGVRYAEGELNDYTSQRRVMGPLAALAHMCDVASTRLWFDYPAESDDPWMGAGRSPHGNSENDATLQAPQPLEGTSELTPQQAAEILYMKRSMHLDALTRLSEEFVGYDEFKKG